MSADMTESPLFMSGDNVIRCIIPNVAYLRMITCHTKFQYMNTSKLTVKRVCDHNATIY